jgi:putative ATP/GTP-binding protein
MKNHYNYISKAPCGKDLFVGKAHQKTAEQIAQKILDAKKSLMIGIEGSWGSGKSNLIQMIEKRVQEKRVQERKSEAIFFTYDAWGHQNDMPRRAMLEELTSKIVQATQALKEDKREYWEERKEKLLAKRKKTSTKTIPKVSAGILVLALMSILTPTCSKIGESLPKTYGAGWDIAITVVPLVFGLGYAGYKFYRLEKKTVKAFLNELLFLYQERTKEETTHEVVFSEEPSSSQFRDWMKDLDKSLQTHLILVFDNMDRLPASKVQEFWAAIHSFFSEEKYEHIRVIIPFDRKHIISAFRGEDGGDKRCYGNDFIDKTFDVVYRVAPPTLSNWKGYLSNQWKEAFGGGLSPEHSITQIYDLLTESKTPREIIAFINDCVTTSETCSASIPDEYIALFIIGKHKINESPQKELLELSFLEPLAYKYRNEKTQKYLSALYYQLPPEEVLDIVYTDQLRRELEKGETTLLKSLVGQPILPGLLENAIVAVTNVENATLAFAEVEKESNTSIPAGFWEQLLQKAPQEEESPKPYQIELLKHTGEGQSKKYLKDVVESIYSRSYSHTSDSEASNDKMIDAPTFYANIAYVQKELREFPDLNPIELLHEAETTPELFIRFVQQAQSAYKDYKISCSMEDVDEYLSGMGIEELERLDIVKHLPTDGRKKLTSFWKSLKDQIQRSTDPRAAKILLKQWVDLRMRDMNAKDEPLMSDSLIRTLYETAEKDPFLEHCLLSMRLARGKDFSYSSMEDILREENEELAKELAQEYIQIFVTYKDLLLMYEEMGEYPLYTGIVRNLIANNLGRHLSIKNVLPHYKEISQTIGVSIDDLLRDWDRFQDSFAEKITEQTMRNIPVDFFRDTAEMQQLQIVSHCRQTAVSYLQSITQDDWEEYFRRGDYEYQLVMELRCDCPNVYEAFKKIIEQEHEDQALILPDEVYSALVALFDEHNKIWAPTYQAIRNRYGERDRDITTVLFMRYGKALIQDGELSKNPKAIQYLLPTALLTDPGTRGILIEKSTEVAQILRAAEENYRNTFSQQALSVYNSRPEQQDQMLRLLSALGIQIPSDDEKE